MKQIFDWLRVRIENKCNYEPVDYDYCDMACSGEQGFVAREDVLDAINEAEAKWEAENTYRCNGNYNDNYKNALKVCPYCGKPIKISEVE